MKVKNMETDKFSHAALHRSQFGLPQIHLKEPKMVIHLDEKTILGINAMLTNYYDDDKSLETVPEEYYCKEHENFKFI